MFGGAAVALAALAELAVALVVELAAELATLLAVLFVLARALAAFLRTSAIQLGWDADETEAEGAAAGRPEGTLLLPKAASAVESASPARPGRIDFFFVVPLVQILLSSASLI